MDSPGLPCLPSATGEDSSVAPGFGGTTILRSSLKFRNSPEDDADACGPAWLFSSDLPTCWVAVDPDGTVCFMAWVFTARDNARVQARWGGLIPELQPDEAVIEGTTRRRPTADWGSCQTLGPRF